VIITMPEATLRAVADHGAPRDLAAMPPAAAQAVVDGLAAAGVPLDDVVEDLERRGVEQFARSGEELLATVESALGAARSAT
jgi:transaldolase